MIGVFLAFAVLAQEPSAEVLQRIAPVRAAMDVEIARQAALPRPRNDAERLDRMGRWTRPAAGP
jgi:hypothetical protein